MVDNDVRVAVLGEFRRGAGRPYRNLLGVFVGTGVGGGLVLGGRLREGRGAAGEIGHTVVKDGGRRCSCGRRGHLEAYAGRGSMERTARRWQARGRRTVLFEVMEEKPRAGLGPKPCWTSKPSSSAAAWGTGWGSRSSIGWRRRWRRSCSSRTARRPCW